MRERNDKEKLFFGYFFEVLVHLLSHFFLHNMQMSDYKAQSYIYYVNLT